MKLFRTALVAFLTLLTSVLWAQVRLPGSGLAKPSQEQTGVVLSAANAPEPHEILREELKAREASLSDSKVSLQGWEDRQEELAKTRAVLKKELKRSRRKVFDPKVQIGDGIEELPTSDSELKHPENIEQMEQYIDVLLAAESLLADLQSNYLEENRLVQAGLEAILLFDVPNIKRKDGEKDREGPVGIRDVERLAREVRGAERRLAQTKALEDQAIFDVERTRDSAPTNFIELADLKPPSSSIDAEGEWLIRELGESEVLFKKNKSLRSKLSAWLVLLGKGNTELFKTRLRYYKIQRYLSEKTLRTRNAHLNLAKEAVQVSSDEQDGLQKRLSRSQKRRTENLQTLREQASALQSSQIGRSIDESDPFSPSKIRDLRLMAITEQRNLEQAKLNRDIFRRDIAQVLNGMLGGQTPGQDFLAKHEDLLSPGYLKARLKQLRHRCESWRRERGSVRDNTTTSQNEHAKESLLNVYSQIEDVCDRQQRVWAHRNFLVNFTRYHIERMERAQRGVLWYAPRILISLLFAFLAFMLTRLLGRLTRNAASSQLAKLTEQTNDLLGTVLKHKISPILYRNLAVLTFFMGSIAIWTTVALTCTSLVWDVAFDIQQVGLWAKHPLLSMSGSDVSLWTIIRLVLIVTGAIWFARFIQGFMANHLLQYFEMDRGVRDALSTLIRYIVLLVGLSFGLASVGIGSGAIAVLFGVIGIGIGFGLQNITSNFVSGLIILFERPIRKGDYVEAGQLFGEVTEINARATTIETRDAISVIVPNSEFINGRVVNWTHGNSQSIRAQIRIGVAYGTDINKVEEVLLSIANSCPDILQRPTPNVHLSEFGDSAMKFELHFWSRRVFSMPTMISDLNKKIVLEFEANNIRIPFPQRDVHVYDSSKDT